MKKKLFTIFTILSLGFISTSCDKLLEFEPGSEVLADEAIRNPDDLQALLNSCYDVVANTYNGRIQNLNELLSDNLTRPLNSEDFLEVYTFSTIFFNGTVGSLYAQPYFAAFRINTMLNIFDDVPGLAPEDKLRIEAEGKFLRALGYFDLVRLFGGAYRPNQANTQLGIVLRTEPDQTPIPRATVEEAYTLINEDLDFAIANLPESNTVYATKWSAMALKAKVLFQQNRMAEAADMAAEVINNGPFTLSDLNRFRQSPLEEAIFTVVSTGANDNRAGAFIGNYRTLVRPQLTLSRNFYDTYNNPEDLRSEWMVMNNEGESNEWIGLTKFDIDWANVPVLHLTDMHLLRAEALALTGNDLSTAANDVNLIKERAGLTPISSSSEAGLIISSARFERKSEMVGEGDRTQDLRRRGAAGEEITIRGAAWDCPGSLLQFPVSENVDGFVFNPQGSCTIE